MAFLRQKKDALSSLRQRLDSLEYKSNMRTLTRLVWILTAVVIGSAQSGCGLLVGNVRPVEDKAEDYRFLDLSKDSSDWQRIEANESKRNDALQATEVSDIAFQSRQTSSIISLNSACRKNQQPDEFDLRYFTKQLLMGISEITERKERDFIHADTPALETTLEGNLNSSRMKLRTIVLRRRDCLFDLMYIARPEQFAKQESDFSRFLAAFRAN